MVRKIIKVAVINISLIVLIFFLLEVFFRIYNEITDKSPEDSFIVENGKYGWVHNLRSRARITKNKCGEDVFTKPPLHHLIIKFPRYEKAGHTILFIGDSYTHAHEVSTGMAYYDRFEEAGKGRFSVYAAAVSGFGTVQEYMMLEEIYDTVKPDYVIWQFCSNDIDNNVFELDSSSFFNNQMPRPYYDLESGGIITRDPGFWLFDLSQGFRYVFLKLVAFDSKHSLGLLRYANSFIELDENIAEIYKMQGMKIAEVLIKKAVKDHPGTVFAGFSVSESYDREFKNVFQNSRMVYWDGFAEYMAQVENTDCAPLDAHWNLYGNIVAGERLFKLFEQLK